MKLKTLMSLALLLAAPVWAQHTDKQTQEDIERHRAMAAAHTAAAHHQEAARCGG